MADPTPADARKVLSSHGHAFQYAVLRRAEELSDHTRWIFEVAEFPVGGPPNTIHIDFVLRSKTGGVYLVAECKRADPARANWCFVKAPYTRRAADENELVFEQVDYRTDNVFHARPRNRSTTLPNCHLGFELIRDGGADYPTTRQSLLPSCDLHDRKTMGRRWGHQCGRSREWSLARGLGHADERSVALVQP